MFIDGPGEPRPDDMPDFEPSEEARVDFVLSPHFGRDLAQYSQAAEAIRQRLAGEVVDEIPDTHKWFTNTTVEPYDIFRTRYELLRTLGYDIVFARHSSTTKDLVSETPNLQVAVGVLDSQVAQIDQFSVGQNTSDAYAKLIDELLYYMSSGLIDQSLWQGEEKTKFSKYIFPEGDLQQALDVIEESKVSIDGLTLIKRACMASQLITWVREVGLVNRGRLSKREAWQRLDVIRETYEPLAEEGLKPLGYEQVTGLLSSVVMRRIQQEPHLIPPPDNSY